MSLKALLRVVAIAVSASLASATCQASNTFPGGKETDTKLCDNQGAGQWTFSMFVNLACIPSPGGGTSGCSGGAQFSIYDESCNIMGQYESPGCGTPFTIEENFLSDVLTVTSVDEDVGSAYFSFNYGDGKYSIRNNHCGCQGDSSGIVGADACKCAFPVDGIFAGKAKRASTGFQA